MESVTNKVFPSSDNLNDCNTKANPRSLLTKGCERLTVNHQMSIWASLKMESVDLFVVVFLILMYIQKQKNQCDRQYQILGAFTFWPTYKQSCAFSENYNTKKQELDASALERKEPHRKLVFARRASWDAGHALVPDRLLCSMLFRWYFRPCAVPPASDRSSSSPTKTAWRWHLLGRDWRKGATGPDRPDKGIIHLTGCAAWLLLSFS